MPRVQNKRGTASALASVNPTPLAGEIVWESDTNRLKVGNGTDAYTTLAYVGAASPTFTGQVTIAAGTAAAPAIVSTTGTADTGTFFPAADTWAVSCAGTERLRITPGGNVRIGTGQTTNAALDVQRTSSTLYATQLGDVSGLFGETQAGIAIKNLSSTTGSFAGYMMLCRRDNASEQVASIGVVSTDATTFTPNLVFTQRTASTAQTERMRLDSSGNFGIATNSPTARLDVNADTMRLRTARTPASAAATGNAGDICWDSSYLYVCTATNTWRRIAHSTW